MTIDVSLIPQNRVENLISKLSEIENNIGNIGTDITNNIVHKNGDETISGLKIIENNIFLKDTQGTIGTSTNQWARRIQFADSTGERIARLEPLYFDAATLQMGMYASNGTTTESGIWVRNTGETYAPHPATAQDSSNRIATTAWVNNLDNSVVHKTGNETITGTKTFNNEIIFNDIPVFNGGKNDSSEGGKIHIACAPNRGWDRDTTIIDEQDGGIRLFNFKNNQVYGYRFDLNDGKGLPKARMVVDAYSSGTSWYRVWSDGWIEQGGQYGSWSNNPQLTISLNKAFTQTNYAVSVFSFGTTQDAYTGQLSFVSRTTSSFVVNTTTNDRGGISWIAMGY